MTLSRLRRGAARILQDAWSKIGERRLQRRIRAFKAQRALLSYNPNPKVTVIIECFNKAAALPRILERLAIPEVEELIAIDDGSADRTLPLLRKKLPKPNHFILHANDLFEIRAYNRALQMAAGQYIVLLQDDDLPPVDGAWIRAACQIFDEHPTLAVLGGRDGLNLLEPDPIPSSGNAEYRMADEIGGCPGVQKYQRIRSHLLQDAGTAGKTLRYVMAVNRSPMWVRKTALLSLGYLDESFAPVSCDDAEFCLRAWLGGWQVALYAAPFKWFCTASGMRQYNVQLLPQQARKNWLEIYKRHGAAICNGALQQLVDQANKTLS